MSSYADPHNTLPIVDPIQRTVDTGQPSDPAVLPVQTRLFQEYPPLTRAYYSLIGDRAVTVDFDLCRRLSYVRGGAS
jgi:hypothetical protein